MAELNADQLAKAAQKAVVLSDEAEALGVAVDKLLERARAIEDKDAYDALVADAQALRDKNADPEDAGVLREIQRLSRAGVNLL